ncbi:probable E3 ubiquitin-protein ligase RHB1A isoform X2 [Morus notabilis]|uniref:probable E3 ubiquitin-protein ligase RHB1A isoform X2 n=1 Tax=Morus notabilis TaxID=981085 RepID=UPI000CED5785|nr:probable E3 ubiquitin-protein ligase RHB1A isoform X2 [Morus notabilis]
MGGCCCCSSKGTELNSAPTYYYYPRSSEEHVPLSSQRGPTLSSGLLVDTNLDTSSPDTYRPPPAPMPYDVAFGRPHSPPVAQEISVDKNGATTQTTNSDTVQEAGGGNVQDPSVKCEDLKESDCKAQTDLELDDTKEVEVELSKSVDAVVLTTEEEDVCPICLEEYDTENPKLTTKCEHHFHLACILEWMERSEACPVCDQGNLFPFRRRK